MNRLRLVREEKGWLERVGAGCRARGMDREASGGQRGRAGCKGDVQLVVVEGRWLVREGFEGRMEGQRGLLAERKRRA